MTKDAYLSSSAQKRLFLINRLQGDSTLYNIRQVWELEGELDLRKLEQAFEIIIQRHEGLRTSFVDKDGKVLQVVYRSIPFKLDVREGNEDCLSQEIERYSHPFDLGTVPLWRAQIVRMGQLRHILMMEIHHIIADGTSTMIMMEDLMAAYRGEELPPLEYQYVDYTMWHNDMLESERKEKQEWYWLSQYEGELPVLELPTDFTRAREMEIGGRTVDFEATERQTDGMDRLAAMNNTTRYALLLSIFSLFLAKESGQEDIVVGTPIIGRPHREFERIIGMFVNTLAIRNRPRASLIVGEYIGEVSSNVFDAFENQDYPFEMLVEKLEPQRQLNRNPLFDVMFAMQNFAAGQQARWGKEGEITGKSLAPEEKESKFDLTLFGLEQVHGLKFRIEYKTGLYREQTIQRMIGHFLNIVDHFIENPEKKISEISIITIEELNHVLFELNNTEEDFPLEKTLHRLMEEKAGERPFSTALVAPGRGENEMLLTYRQMNRQANRVAQQLKRWGIGTGNIVAVRMKPTAQRVIAVYGILKAGAAYMPIDIRYPEERVRYMMADSNARRMLTDEDVGEMIAGPEHTEGETIQYTHSPGQLCYVIYTSGSTGRPKGVMLEHRNMVNLLNFQIHRTVLNFGGRVLQFASIGFDASAQEIFSTHAEGGTLYVVEENIKYDMNRLFRYIEKRRINTMIMPAALIKFVFADPALARTFPTGVEHIIASGEQLIVSPDLNVYMRKNNVTLHNHYGPSETHVVTTLTMAPGPTDHEEIPTIGSPLSNTRIYILDKHNHPQPVGVVGELYIAGSNLGQGYLNNPELTAERFVFGHWSRSSGSSSLTECTPYYRPSYKSYYRSKYLTGESLETFPCDRLYRTGDRARWRDDGTIEFRGRVDHQVKIRGFRVEPGEIESLLMREPQIKQAAVLAKEDFNGTQGLIAYVVPETGEHIDGNGVKNRLAQQLPDYMVPSDVIVLDNIPLNTSGKVDRRALETRIPVPDQEKSVVITEPRDEIENKLLRVWSTVLEKEPEAIGIDQNFFQQGGHSLKGMVLISRIKKEFGKSEIMTLAELFRRPTIRNQADYLRQKTGSSIYTPYTTYTPYTQVPVAEEKEYYPLTPAQKRLFLLQQMEKENRGYNLPTVVEIKGALRLDRLEKSFIAVISRHESLRTVFYMHNGQPVQQVIKDVSFEIRKLSKDGQDTAAVIERYITPFDLSKAPLIRAGLMKTAIDTYILIIDMHHIISDGVSHNIVIKELADHYEGRQLPPVSHQYKDFAQWRLREEQQEEIFCREQYWIRRFDGENGTLPVLELPYDYPRPPLQSYEGDTVGDRLEERETQAMVKLAHSNETTLYALMLTIYNIVLSRLSQQKDIVVGTPVFGRRHADQQNIVGMFVNTLALRNRVPSEGAFSEYLRQIARDAVEAFENQDYPFEDLVEKLKINRDPARNPLFDVALSVQNYGEASKTINRRIPLENPELEIAILDWSPGTSKFDLTLYVIENAGKLNLSIEYSTKLFRRSTIQRYLNYIKQTVAEITAIPEGRLENIEIIPPTEKSKILKHLNHGQSVRCNNTTNNTTNKTTNRNNIGSNVENIVEWPQNKTIHRLFEEQVERTPHRIAIVSTAPGVGTRFIASTSSAGSTEPHTQGALTYRQLNREADRIAGYLIENGVRPETIVALMMDRSIDAVINIIGILKAGAAYLPIDPETPEERIRYILKDSNATLLKKNKFEARNRKRHRETMIPQISSEKSSGMLAYVIYTSGTTGHPKGAMVEHRNVVQLILNDGGQFNFNENDIWTQTHSNSFDFSVWEIFGPLLTGGRLVPVSYREVLSPRRLLEIVERHGVTVFNQTPSAFNNFMEVEEGRVGGTVGIRYVIFGGEELKPQKLRRWKKKYPKTRLINMFGITETTVHVTYKEIGELEIEARISNIGKPIPTLRVRVVDPRQRQVPFGVPGELVIAGDGVCRGYLNRSELTAEKFVESSTPGEVERRREYRSGDQVRVLENGDMEYLGRIDHQVKVRGYRVEPGEIEARLQQYEGIKENVVLKKTDGAGIDYLAAKLIMKKEHQLNRAELRGFLATQLPEYMIPAQFDTIESIPLTKNGKIDRKKLETMTEQSRETGEQYEAPRNEVETEMAEIWRRILGLEETAIGINDDFFQIGGNSLNAVRFVSEIESKFGVEIPILQIFTEPRIKDLSKYIYRCFKDREESPVLLLNQPQERKLFCFPPGSGLAVAFKKIATKISGRAVYSFNFIEGEEIEKIYVQKIKEIQPQGPYLLFGYSAGGNIAFEVAKELERRNNIVSDLILLESLRKLKTRDVGRKEMMEFEKMMRYQLTGYGNYDLDIQNMVENGIKYYRYFSRQVKNVGRIKAEIHLITSRQETDGEKYADSWQDTTESEIRLYSGYGEHSGMLTSGAIEGNAEILNRILEEIGNR